MSLSIRMIKGGVLLAVTLALAACRTPQPADREMLRCGFSDPETMATLGILDLVAEYYVAHHAWPSSREQLKAQLQVMLKEGKADLTPEEAKAVPQFLDRYTLLEFHRQGLNLMLHYRFKVEGKVTEETAILKPGRTADGIIERSALEQR
jgi:hypothetical protein